MPLLIRNFTKNKIDRKYLNRVAEKTLETVKFKKPSEISLVITGEKRIRTLNKKYRKIDKATDVLSFGNEENDKFSEFENSPDGIIYLGEIFICYPKIIRQAKRKRHTVKKEITILLIHGILHLLGYDHKEKYENSEMKTIEDKVFKSL